MKTVLATLNAKYIHMSLALRYLKAYCGREFEVELAEYTIKDPAMSVVADLFRRGPDVVGFSCYIWNIEETLRIVRMLKQVRPDVRVVLGGPEVSYDTQEWMRRVPEVDFIVMGEGEETLYHLLSELRDGTGKFHYVFGVAYRGRDGAVAVNPGRPKAVLDELPSPHYEADDAAQLPNRVVYFETSRGCPFSCQFCLSSIEVGVRYFDIERTKRDLLHLIRSGARLIKFVDRTFNIRREYALEVFRFLIGHHGGTCVFQFEITADIMRPEVIAFLSEHAPAGVFRFEIGVQSTNELTNELIQRRQNFGKLARTVTMIRESGKIAQHLDLIAGLPEEDYASFRKTFNDVFALRPEELQLGFLKMLRGTGLRARAAEYGYVYMEQAPYEMLGNRVLPFADVVRIKQVEDVLEKYWNAHRADATVKYLVDEVFASAWDFFQAFGAYWESRGWERIGHQLEDLFVRLRAFLAAVAAADPRLLDLAVADGLMKMDYLAGHKYRPRKIWWDMTLSEREHAAWLRRLLERPDDVVARWECGGGGKGNGNEGGDGAGAAAGDGVAGDVAGDGEESGGIGDRAGDGGGGDKGDGRCNGGDPGRRGAFAALGLSERELRKQVMIERVPFDLAAYWADGRVRWSGSGAGGDDGGSLLVARFAADAGRYAELYAVPLSPPVPVV